ncbi:hypothetical protein MKX01_041607 [Papaver californicum]|nr:hypothetical protein MKX01_041607 [Papaver californicum]
MKFAVKAWINGGRAGTGGVLQLSRLNLLNIQRNKTTVDRTVCWLDECISLNQACRTSVLGAIVGGSNVDERIRCAQEVTKRNELACQDNLPKEKPRQIYGLGLPEEILQGVAAVIDLFDSTYIYQLTLGGFALTFPLNRSERQLSDSYMSDSSGSDNTKINLRATIHRASINHQINVHEMQAQILLEMKRVREGQFDMFC